MSQVTDIRRALAAQVEGLGISVKIGVGGSDLGVTTPHRPFIVRVIVGPLCDENEDRLDELLDEEGEDSVKERLERTRDLGGLVHDLLVVRHSGYRTYTGPDGKPQIGAEWTVNCVV